MDRAFDLPGSVALEKDGAGMGMDLLRRHPATKSLTGTEPGGKVGSTLGRFLVPSRKETWFILDLQGFAW
jgi:hypothetical protein